MVCSSEDFKNDGFVLTFLIGACEWIEEHSWKLINTTYADEYLLLEGKYKPALAHADQAD